MQIAFGGLFLAAGALSQSAMAADRAQGRKLANQCRTCHGIEGLAKIPIAPHIGGEPESYIQAQLTAFRDGTRQHEMMSIVARQLSDEQIADLAAWYSGHQVSATLEADPSKAPEQCIVCHGANGIHVNEDAPNLAGESTIYIDTQLKAFRSGKRTNTVMTPIAKELSDDQIRAFADWYANVKIDIKMAE